MLGTKHMGRDATKWPLGHKISKMIFHCCVVVWILYFVYMQTVFRNSTPKCPNYGIEKNTFFQILPLFDGVRQTVQTVQLWGYNVSPTTTVFVTPLEFWSVNLIVRWPFLEYYCRQYNLNIKCTMTSPLPWQPKNKRHVFQFWMIFFVGLGI